MLGFGKHWSKCFTIFWHFINQIIGRQHDGSVLQKSIQVAPGDIAVTRKNWRIMGNTCSHSWDLLQGSRLMACFHSCLICVCFLLFCMQQSDELAVFSNTSTRCLSWLWHLVSAWSNIQAFLLEYYLYWWMGGTLIPFEFRFLFFSIIVLNFIKDRAY